jgi:hypothetical protein
MWNDHVLARVPSEFWRGKNGGVEVCWRLSWWRRESVVMEALNDLHLLEVGRVVASLQP